jgi:hypothetical protein
MWLGGKAGRTVGAAVGGAVAGDDKDAAQSSEAVYSVSVAALPIESQGTLGIYRETRYRDSPRPVNDLIVTPQGQFSTHPDDYILAMKNPAALINAGITAVSNQYQNFQGAPGLVQDDANITSPRPVNDLIVTPQGQFSAHPDDYILAMKNPAALVSAGVTAVSNQYQNFQGAPGLVQDDANIASPRPVNDMIVTPQGQFSAHPDDYIPAMKNPAALVNAGIAAVNNQYQHFQGAPGLVQNNTNTASPRPVNDMIVTPQGQFSAHPDDYILAMRNPAALVNNEARNEVHSVGSVPQAVPPVVVDGEIELKSELIIDDKGYRLRQAVGKNTTPYKFAVGSAKNARLVQ